MRRLCGFGLFCVALGMIIGLCITKVFWCCVLVFVLLLIGYNMFVC